MSEPTGNQGGGSRSALAAVTGPDGRTSLRRLPVPEVAPGGGLLRVAATGVCGTDVSLARGGRLRGPTILGHHVVGWMEAVGRDAARRWGVGPGDLVAVQEYLPCRRCRWCRAGEFRLCDRADIRQQGRRFGTVPVDEPPALWGGNAQVLYLPPETLVHRLPASMPPARAVWLLPLANAFDWTCAAGQLRPGDAVVVVGPGQHGLTCVTAARQSGAGTVLAVGLAGDEDRLALAKRLGADDGVVAEPATLADAVVASLGGQGADLVVDTSGAGVALLPTLVGMAGKGARIVETGLDGGDAYRLSMAAVTARAITIAGVRGRRLAAVDRAVASLDVAAGGHPLDAVPTTEVGLDGVDALLRPGPPQRRNVHTVVYPAVTAGAPHGSGQEAAKERP